jgi:ABC-type cobalamin/Fe3+-siderophores transport system ATPase subunit
VTIYTVNPSLEAFVAIVPITSSASNPLFIITGTEIAVTEKKTVIFSTHDLMQALKLCDKIWVMGYTRFFEGEPGELIEKGAFDQMFKDSSLKFDSKLVTFI